MHKEKLILDVDSDVDNLIAIAYALQSESLDLLAISTVHGLEDVNKSYQNVNWLLEALADETPLFMGAARPYMRDRLIGKPSHVSADESIGEASSGMYKLISNSERDVSICLLGPATNLILLLRRYPELSQKIKRIIFAGGSYSFGTITASACHRVYLDAEAMQELIHKDIPFYMLSIDETSGFTDIMSCRQMISSWQGNLWQKLRTSELDLEQPLRSPLALAAATHPDSYTSENYKCEIELHGDITYGMTVVYKNNFAGVFELEDGSCEGRDVLPEDKNIFYIEKLDRAALITEIADKVKNLDLVRKQ